VSVSCGRWAELGGRDVVALGFRFVVEDAGGRAVLYFFRAVLRPAGSIVFPYTTLFRSRDRDRDGGRAAALGVGRAVGRAVVAGRVGEGAGDVLAADVAVAGVAVGVEGHASVGGGAELGGREGAALGVRGVAEEGGGRAV